MYIRLNTSNFTYIDYGWECTSSPADSTIEYRLYKERDKENHTRYNWVGTARSFNKGKTWSARYWKSSEQDWIDVNDTCQSLEAAQIAVELVMER